MDLCGEHLSLIPSLEDRLPEGDYRIVLAQPDIVSEELMPHHHHTGRWVDYLYDVFMADAFGIEIDNTYSREAILDKAKDKTFFRRAYGSIRYQQAIYNQILDQMGLPLMREQFPAILAFFL